MDITKALAANELFQGMTASLIEKIAAICIPTHYLSGIEIFDRGTKGKEIYIVPHGRVALELTTIGETVTEELDQALENEVFGEMALVHDYRRSARATALEDIELLKIDCAALLELLDRNHEDGYNVMRNLAKILARKVVHTNLLLRNAMV
ncbi:hypothetical protein BOW53_02760 [Solemya pervernicosa gill symbiont]|uniref:Cyclic nucleotide-binding domain-containing protein n=2 Tax=Gammaproteobacteria incertae sedis TaxID=118884 RepID=A0A1T2L938_9GAMM|nr:cyclic nucleotide-binding domain-containing protein [Candidatus Reidiella endopervernicosa]OOZ41619.1 hypothetical protein BOW53_02760 [Solemya pervernicosa gill symbiont]QKQ26884.1 cyclic nucleotide-binding domain-containing protein [Candidatus Reidiella endopervernicosa]